MNAFCAYCICDDRPLTMYGHITSCLRCAKKNHHLDPPMTAKQIAEGNERVAKADAAAARERKAADKRMAKLKPSGVPTRRLAPGEVLKEGRTMHIGGGSSTFITTIPIDHSWGRKGKS